MGSGEEVGLENAARAWLGEKRRAEASARERVALQIGCGVDWEAALASRGEARERLALKLKRLIERERGRAGRPHLYDLDRHVALKKALDRLEGRTTKSGTIAPWRKSYGSAL
ncbi:MAG TPA: cytoplasmic protein [Mesorhizobium sp.]|jgi:hypothetical protein|nr:cytoplasmic protein [Mesorhizobium sp.]